VLELKHKLPSNKNLWLIVYGYFNSRFMFFDASGVWSILCRCRYLTQPLLTRVITALLACWSPLWINLSRKNEIAQVRRMLVREIMLMYIYAVLCHFLGQISYHGEAGCLLLTPSLYARRQDVSYQLAGGVSETAIGWSRSYVDPIQVLCRPDPGLV